MWVLRCYYFRMKCLFFRWHIWKCGVMHRKRGAVRCHLFRSEFTPTQGYQEDLFQQLTWAILLQKSKRQQPLGSLHVCAWRKTRVTNESLYRYQVNYMHVETPWSLRSWGVQKFKAFWTFNPVNVDWWSSINSCWKHNEKQHKSYPQDPQHLFREDQNINVILIQIKKHFLKVTLGILLC